MSILVRIPTPLRRFTNGSDEVNSQGVTVGGVVEDLENRHPGLKERLCDDTGKVRRFVNIYVNGDDIRFLNHLDTAVKDGDEMSIVPAIAGDEMPAGQSIAESAVTSPRGRPSRALTALDLVGNTPLVEISRLTRSFRTRKGRRISPKVRIYAKLEGFNPGGSVKDRPALWMIRGGIESGRLTHGKTILDSTSGNTGIALAMIGAVLGYPVELVMPENVSQERKTIIAAYGAQITYSSPMEGSDGAIRLCRQVLAANPEKYFKPDQYFNENNPRAHYESTGPEIWHDTNGTVTHFVAAIGTGGTIMGTGRYLKECNARIQVIAVEPEDALHGLEGLKHMASSIVPGIYHETELDRKIAIATEDAYDTVYQLGAEEGLVVGQSSGAAMWAALQLAAELDEGVIVLIFCDFGDKYLSTNLWAGWRDWLRTRRHTA